MKDYYKILGVGEEASEEEIRARWTELTKRYHPDPDLGATEEEGEKIREINEAYEILRNEPSRFRYDFERDLKRSFIKKAHREQKRRTNLRKIILIPSAGILVLFLIAGFFLLKRSEVGDERNKGAGSKVALLTPPVKGASKAQEETGVLREMKKEVIPKEGESGKKKESESKERFASPVVTKAERPAPKVVSREAPKETLKPTGKEISKEASRESPKPAAKEIPKEASVEVAKEVPGEIRKEVSKEVPKEAPREIPKEVAKEVVREPPKEATQGAPKKVLKEVPKEISKPVAKEAPKEPLKEVSKVTLHPGENLTLWPGGGKVVSSRPPLAKEEEVTRFFSNYVDRYNRKDVEGFLSFFSTKAVQNQKEGLEAIGNLYTKSVDQSEELRYQIEGMKIEIYQNRVEVKARFRLDQKLKKDGTEKASKGNIRWVLVREDGHLKILSIDY